MRTSDLFSQPIWSELGRARFHHYTVLFLSFAAPCLLLIPGAFASLAAGLVLVATVLSVGPQAAFAVVFFLVSACALGSLILNRNGEGSLEEDARSTLLGIGIFIFVMTFLARLPVNYPWVWGALLAAPILADVRGTARRLARWARMLLSTKLTSWAEPGGFALVVFTLAMDWLVTLKPETGADGLAMHLAIATNIAARHMMTFQPGRFLWSVMPMGADWLFSITCVLGGEMAARLLNLAMLLLIDVQLYAVFRRWLPRSVCFLLVALFTTTPMVQLVTGSLFVENLLAAVVVGAVTALIAFAETGEKKSLYLAMTLSGTALATKFGALAIVAIVVLLTAREIWRRRSEKGFRPGLTLMLASALFLCAALPTYTIAWRMTRNPLYPFLNQKFPSPVLAHDADMNDPRFTTPVTWNTPFDLTFRTHLYYEAQDGSLGFQYLLFVPFGLLAAVVVKRRAAAIAVVAALGGLFVVLIELPNARYMYPALTLLAIPFAAFLEWLGANRRWLYYASLAFVVGCTGLNIWFFPSSGWYQKDFYAKNPFSRAGRADYIRDYVPRRYVIQKFNHDHPLTPVYLDTFADIADVPGQEAYGAFAHQWPILMTLRATKGVPNLARLFRQWKIRYFIVEDAPDETSDLHDFLAACTREEFRDGHYYLADLLPECDTDNEKRLQAQAYTLMHPLQVVQKGTYDDYGQEVQFRGAWAHSTIFKSADSQTISFSNSPDSEVALAFTGTAVTYVFTKAPNRGRAEVVIDGVSKGIVDLYSAKIEWQDKARYCCLKYDRHTVIVRVTGEKSAGSTGAFVDLDSFVVE